MQTSSINSDLSGDEQALPHRAAQENSTSTKTPHPWILSPVLDYLFCCGGLMWILAGIEQLGVKPGEQTYPSIILGGVLFWGSLLLSEAHGPATLVRVFRSHTTPRSVRLFVIAWAVVLIGFSIYALQSEPVAQVFTKITLVWLVQHYIAQTFGVVLIYCMKRNFELSKIERGVVQWLLRSLMFFVILRMFTVPAYGHLKDFLGMEIPFYGPLPFWPMYTAAFILTLCCFAFVGLMVARYVRKKQIFPLPALVTIFSVAALTLSQRDAFFLLGVTFYHASQYLAVTYSYFLKEEAQKEGRTISGSHLKEFLNLRSLGYIVLLVCAGFMLSIGLPQGMIRNGVTENICLCVLYSMSNCHHFLTDAFVWRIRKKEVRELLV